MTTVGFETTISVGERTKTYALDRAATGTGEGRFRDLKTCDIVLHLPVRATELSGL
jgi:hypothetical protein